MFDVWFMINVNVSEQLHLLLFIFYQMHKNNTIMAFKSKGLHI